MEAPQERKLVEPVYTRMGRSQLLDQVKKLRALVFEARPTHWVEQGDSAAARAWEGRAAVLLELDRPHVR